MDAGASQRQERSFHDPGVGVEAFEHEILVSTARRTCRATLDPEVAGAELVTALHRSVSRPSGASAHPPAAEAPDGTAAAIGLITKSPWSPAT
jgi:hypothetical protein